MFFDHLLIILLIVICTTLSWVYMHLLLLQARMAISAAINDARAEARRSTARLERKLTVARIEQLLSGDQAG